MSAAVIDRDFLFQTLADLIRINSVNPTLVPGGAGEAEISDYVARVLNGIGLDVRKLEPEAGRISVLGTLAGSGGGRSLMLNAHYDTVGVEGMDEPFSSAIRDGKIFGRGSFDMKGSLAAQIAAVKALRDAGIRPRGDVVIAAVADEEYGSLRTMSVIDAIKTDAAIVTEPTAVQICLAHKGYLWIEVETRGRAAHGSRFKEGVDANMRMGRFLAQLDKLEQDLRARTPHPLVGPPSLHAAMLHGGDGLSTYAASCKLQIERRTVPGETEKQAVGEVQAIVNSLHSADPTFQAEVRPFFVRDPFEVPRDAEIVKTLARASRTVLGREPNYMGDTPWMDAALLHAAGIETVVMGPGGGGAHAVVEWVEMESVAQMAAILAHAAIEYCA
ncbi:MAG TPA: ArgE/DapE family deacylase [Bryobacteraceae bacterium]|nr:ArgE/DapE family deacylase [Bryobacteraceae bacterium]